MKIALLLSVMTLTIWSYRALGADDIRSKVRSSRPARWQGSEIDPDSNIYGVPFDASEDDLIKAQGKPDGYMRLDERQAALIYGGSQAFVFEDGKLVGIRIANQILDWRLANEGPHWGRSDMPDWRLNSGVYMGMNRKEVRRLLGDKLMEGQFGQHYYVTAKARVELDFAQYQGRGDGDEAYTLFGIYVRQGASGEEQKRLGGLGGWGGLSPAAETEGFGGIGAILRADEHSGGMKIMGVLPGTPAARAGLQVGQIIRSIDNVPTQGKLLRATVQSLRGQPGTKVTLELFDPVKAQTRVIELTREQIVSTGSEWVGSQTNITITTGPATTKFEGVGSFSAPKPLLAGADNAQTHLIPDLQAWTKVEKGLPVAELEKLLGQPIRRIGPYGDYMPDVVYRWNYGYVATKSELFPEDLAFTVSIEMGRVWSKEDPFGGVTISKDGTATVPKLMSPPDGAVFSHYPRFLDFRWYASSGDYPMKYEIDISVLYPSGQWSRDGESREVAIPYYSYGHPGANRGRWKVRTVNAKGKSQWSEYFYFGFKV